MKERKIDTPIVDEIWQPAPNSGAHWIFPARPDDAVNQYVDLLHTFECDTSAADAQLLISADTDFIVWLNGECIGDGQYSNYPNAKTYERFAVGELLREGRNTLAINVFYNGRTSSVYERGEPGLVFEVRGRRDRVLAASGTDTLCRPNPCYHSGPIAIVSGQLAYTFGYDARAQDAFWKDGYAPGDEWRSVTAAEAKLPKQRAALAQRPVPRLVDGETTTSRLAQAGRFRYDMALVESEQGYEPVGQTAAGLELTNGAVVSPAWLMQNADLASGSPAAIAGVSEGVALNDLDNGLPIAAEALAEYDGIYLLFDLGREEVGHLELEIEAADGTIVDVGYGEHLDDGRVRTQVGGRNFAGRYICREGRQHFTHPFLRWAGRYLQLHVHAKMFTLHQLSLRRREYPVKVRGEVNTGSELHDRIHDVGCRTLHLCMHEHYEDTPWREQALYANDARIQALCGYYAFGETAMPAASFNLLGQGLRDDGFLNLTAPAKPPVTIPSFTFAWMLAVRDHYLYSGDDSLARAFLPQIRSMLKAFLDERENGLLPLRRQKGNWHFYDWSAGMSGYSDDDLSRGLHVDAPLNCFLILALEAAVQMLDWCAEPGGYEFNAAVKDLRQAVAESFWDARENVFKTHANAEIMTELTQALAILAKVGDPGMREKALQRMARDDSGLARPGLSQSFYTFEALMTRKSEFGTKVLHDIEETWGRMLDAGATAFWETSNGASDFSNAGSLCHGWSAVPVYVLYHDLLGVRPLEPGFRTFAVDPMPQAVSACSGRVPTSAGDIVVSWEKAGGGDARCSVTAPQGLKREPGREHPC